MGSCYNGLACGHAVWPAVVWGAVTTLVTAPCMQGELRLSEPCQPSVSRMTAAIQPRVSLGHITRLPPSSLCVISVHVHDRKTLYPSAYARAAQRNAKFRVYATDLQEFWCACPMCQSPA